VQCRWVVERRERANEGGVRAKTLSIMSRRCVHETKIHKNGQISKHPVGLQGTSMDLWNILQQPGGFKALNVDRKYRHSILRTSRADHRLSNDIRKLIEETQAMAYL
jgi:hypothetical protein